MDGDSLERFTRAQAEVYPQALAELKAGRKRSHWIWFILPQMLGLGTSHMSTRYGIRGLDEARAYLAHPQLGPRYLECLQAIHGWIVLRRLPAPQLMGGDLDALKLRSSLELFRQASPVASSLHDLASEIIEAMDKA